MTTILFWLLRVASLLLACGLVATPILIGTFLEGNYPALGDHAFVGGALIPFTFVTFLVALLLVAATRARFPWWPAALLAVMAALVTMQSGWGYGRTTSLHVPNGVFLVGAGVFLSGWLWAPGRLHRSARAVHDRRGLVVESTPTEAASA